MSLNVAREPKTRHRYPFEPQWGPEGAELPRSNSVDEEPIGYIDKMSPEERNKLARGRLRFRAGGERWIGGKTWHVEAGRRGLDADRRGVPADDRLSRRPLARFSAEPGELYNPSSEVLGNDPMFQTGENGRFNGGFEASFHNGEDFRPQMAIAIEPLIPALRDRGLVS